MKKIGFVIVGLFIIALIFGISQIVKNPEKYNSASTEASVVFDAMQYEVKDNSNISESELIQKLGEPDNIEEWNYETETHSYPIRTLHYGNYEYSFNDDNLQRLTIWDEIPYTSKDDFLNMFGLKKYANTMINDTGLYYRAFNCGVNDIWIEYTDSIIKMVKISYGTVFSS